MYHQNNAFYGRFLNIFFTYSTILIYTHQSNLTQTPQPLHPSNTMGTVDFLAQLRGTAICVQALTANIFSRLFMFRTTHLKSQTARWLFVGNANAIKVQTRLLNCHYGKLHTLVIQIRV